ncbi:MAG: glycosyltransferase family 4 protein [Ignavibacterium album]|uniref:glycosyltransferase family 4 protein n=1 Tax=Ignavibacterium album TaxID=591197 RepID=UPI0026F17806|nr:glycosyltransferase family 4 protein [Ignavibacterium album]MCX8104706.1 glycosyltransferase family 4 protein [Ignavibacterium album]
MKVLHILRDLGLTGVPRFVEFFCSSNFSKENLQNFVFTTNDGVLRESISKNAILIGYKKKLKYSPLPILLLLLNYKKYKIDLVHIHFNPWGILFVYLMNVPAILTLHVLPNENRIEGTAINYFLKKMCKRKNFRLVAVSKRIALESAKILNIDIEKISVIYNGVNINNRKDSLLEKNNVTKKIIIGQVGSLSEAKGQYYSIKAATILKEKGYNFEIYFAGEGPSKEKLITLVNELNLNSNIKFIGNIIFSDFVEKFIPDIIIMPSLSETFGFVIIETWSYGIPVIASRVQGPMEIIEDGESGLLIEPSNSSDLAEKIEELILNPAIRKKLILGGFEQVKQFDIEKTVKNYFRHYISILSL